MISIERCDGFGFIDLLFAMLIVSVGTMGLIRYHHGLSSQFYGAAESLQSWRLAGQLLDIYPASPPAGFTRWQYWLSFAPGPAGCTAVEATVRSPTGYEARLKRFVCRINDGYGS